MRTFTFATMRRLHLYLGCFFAPLLLLFVVTGTAQMFGLHRAWKNSTYTPPAALFYASELHTRQGLGMSEDGRREPNRPFRVLVVAMAIGLSTAILSGIAMALRATRPQWLVWATLAAGALFPVLLLVAG